MNSARKASLRRIVAKWPMALSWLGLAFIVGALAGCAVTAPGAGVRKPSYPALTQTTRTYNWLVVKCQLSDAPTIPAGLDTKIQQFFGISGMGYGNIPDYFHDVSYNHASVLSDTTVGWVTAPFSTANLQTGPLAPSGARLQRVSQCLNAIAADQLPDLDRFYGVVVVNNVVQDGGSCVPIGPTRIVVNNKSFNLACVWFDPNSLFTGFAAHEIGHGLGLTHSYDDSQKTCGGAPGEYCDPWDIMSAMATFTFNDGNWTTPGVLGNEGPGLSGPGLIRMGWLPSLNIRNFQVEGGEQTFKLRALSRPRAGEPMVIVVPVASQQGASGFVTVEYRQNDGWDKGFATARRPEVLKNGGAVLVHRANTATAQPLSWLIENTTNGALGPCGKLVFNGDDGIVFHVTVENFDLADGSATVSMGFGRSGKILRCVTDVIKSPGGIEFPKP
jgi:hypothetical protein